jgi:hypothetical protein
MPQSPLNLIAKTVGGALSLLNLDLQNAQLVSTGGTKSILNITAASVVKATPGRLVRLSVLVAGAVGTVNDCATTGAAATANQIAVIPAAVGSVVLEWPCAVGIVIVPGAAQVLSVSYI